MYAIALQAADRGLTLGEILLDIPHDLTALVVYLMLAVYVLFIGYANRFVVLERYRVGPEKKGPEPTKVPDGGVELTEQTPMGPRTAARSQVPPAVRKPVRRRSRDAVRISWIG